MSLGTILLIILILALLGALPSWPYSSGWGYYPSGGLGLIVLILVVLLRQGDLAFCFCAYSDPKTANAFRECALARGRNLDAASSREQLDDDFVLISQQGDIDRPAGDLEPAQDHFLQEVRQD